MKRDLEDPWLKLKCPSESKLSRQSGRPTQALLENLANCSTLSEDYI